MGNKKTKRKDKKKKTNHNVTYPTSDRHVGNPSSTDNTTYSVEFSTITPRKPKFPYRLYKGNHLLNYCHGLSQFLDVWSEASQHSMSSVFHLHIDDTSSTSDSVVKSPNQKAKYPCSLCKDMHLTYLCTLMDEDSKFLEYIIAPQQWLQAIYCNLLDFYHSR